MKLKASHLTLFAAINLSGCSSLFISDNDICFDDNGIMTDCAELSNGFTATMPRNEIDAQPVADPNLFKSNVNFQLLSEYLEQMAVNLKRDIATTPIDSSIAITSFVNLDSSRSKTQTLSHHISEYFFNELQSSGLLVSDYKINGLVKATANGDVALTRDILQLKPNTNIGYVLTGTLVQHERGVLVHARVVSLLNNNVVAANSKLIPTYIANRFF